MLTKNDVCITCGTHLFGQKDTKTRICCVDCSPIGSLNKYGAVDYFAIEEQLAAIQETFTTHEQQRDAYTELTEMYDVLATYILSDAENEFGRRLQLLGNIVEQLMEEVTTCFTKLEHYKSFSFVHIYWWAYLEHYSLQQIEQFIEKMNEHIDFEALFANDFHPNYTDSQYAGLYGRSDEEWAIDIQAYIHEQLPLVNLDYIPIGRFACCPSCGFSQDVEELTYCAQSQSYLCYCCIRHSVE